MSKVIVPMEVHQLCRDNAKGRPYTLLRHVGNRVEVMYYGDYEPTVVAFDPPKGTGSPTGDLGSLEESQTAHEIDLSAKTVAELKEICFRLGIPTSKKKKADLVSAIEAAID